MKAILMTAVGEASVLSYQDVDEPQISETTQIKVKLQAAGVNPVDTKVRRHGVFYEQPLPAVSRLSHKKRGKHVVQSEPLKI